MDDKPIAKIIGYFKTRITQKKYRLAHTRLVTLFKFKINFSTQ